MKKILEYILFFGYGVLLIFLIFSERINYFLHPSMQPFLIIMAVLMLAIILFNLMFLRSNCARKSEIKTDNSILRLTILSLPLIIGFFVYPSTLSSQQFWNRQNENQQNVILSRNADQEAKFVFNSENRSLENWLRLFSQSYDFEQFINQKVKLSGFIVKDRNYQNEVFYLSRYVISCCAADARSVGLPVQFNSKLLNFNLEEDQWVEIEGYFIENNFEKIPEKLLIQLEAIREIEIPKNPYITQ